MTASPGTSEIAHVPAKPNPWKLIFRVTRWSTYGFAVITILLIMRTAPPPHVETNPQAAARVEQKIDEAQQAAATGQGATLRMDQTELNSFLASHMDIASSKSVLGDPTNGINPAGAANSGADASADSSGQAGTNGAGDIAGPVGTTAEQIDQVRSSVKDVKVELLDDRVRAYVIFDFHGKDMSLQLEGKLGASDGYLHFVPVSGQIGSLPIPQSTLEAAVQEMMESPENREKLRLPADMSDLRIENGQVVATYK